MVLAVVVQIGQVVITAVAAYSRFKSVGTIENTSERRTGSGFFSYSPARLSGIPPVAAA